MANPTSKPALIEKILHARQQLNQVLGGLTPQQLTAPGPEGWSVKDHLAHLAVWARKEIAVLEGRSADEGLGLPPGSHESLGFDEINATLRERSQALSLEETLAELGASHTALLRAVQALPDEKLSQPARPGANFTWAQSIAGNSCDHDEEHTQWIKAMLGS